MGNQFAKYKYRPELDGLRFIAITSVIFYHAKLSFFGKNDLFSGGYIGVDIFFVLSGFLITKSILNEIKNRNYFDFLNFYERRVRRILPMLITILLVSLFMGWRILTLNDLVEFGRSGVSALFFFSNYFFHNITTQYGAESSLLKPLLNTWSLAIEVQFYLIYPIIFLVFYKFFKNNTQIIIFSTLLLSLQFAEILLVNDPAFNYFHSFSRFWEFAFGSLVAYSPHFIVYKKRNFLFNLLPLLGLCLITYSIIFFDGKTEHPGLITIIPILGTYLLIAFSSKDEFIGKILGFKPFVWIGKISYSGYLWHYPLFAFYRIHNPNPSNESKIFLIIISLIVSLISYLLIEKPFQSKISRKLFYSIIFPSFVLIISLYCFLGYLINEKIWYKYANQKLITSFEIIKDTEEENSFLDQKCKFNIISDDQNKLKSILEECRNNYGKAVFIFGDSHAKNTLNAIGYSEKYPFLIGIVQDGCRPYGCKKNLKNQYTFFKNKVLPLIRDEDTIIFHQSGSHLFKSRFGNNDQPLIFKEGIYSIDFEMIDKIDSYLSAISLQTNAKLIWLTPFVEYRMNPKEIISAIRNNNSYEKYKSINKISIKAFNELEETFSKLKPDKYKVLLFDDFYKVDYKSQILDEFGNACFQFRDQDHFSRCGEKIMGKNANLNFIN